VPLPGPTLCTMRQSRACVRIRRRSRIERPMPANGDADSDAKPRLGRAGFAKRMAPGYAAPHSSPAWCGDKAGCQENGCRSNLFHDDQGRCRRNDPHSHSGGINALSVLAASTATATILPIHLLPPAGRAGPIGFRQVWPTVAVESCAAVVATMSNTVAPPASPISHRLSVGLHSG
jgi:hypothetical protein